MIRLLFFFLIIQGTVQAQQSDFKNIDFHNADSIAKLYKGKKLDNIATLTYKLTLPLPTQVEKFRAIYTWVSTNIENDYWYNVKNQKKREQLKNDRQGLIAWNNDFRKQVFKKLLKEQKTICTGYAYLIKEMAALVDINCVIVDGFGRTVASNIEVSSGIPNHSWNAVQLNDKWYLCDATWSSGVFNLQEDRFIAEYYDGYFLTSPELFVKNHYPLDDQWICLTNKPSLEEFLNGPIVYRGAFKYQLIPLKPNTLKSQITKNESLTFMLQAPENTHTDNLKLELVSGGNVSIAKPDISRTQEGLLAITHTFNRIGQYDVHLKMDNEYLITYTIKVKKNKNRN